MTTNTRLDLLLKEIEDPYVQENFRKLRRYLDCLDTGQLGPRGLQGPAGAPGQDGTSDQKYIMNTPAAVSVGNIVYQDYTQVNFADKYATNDSPSPFIGIVITKETSTTACVQTRGLYDLAIAQGPLFVSTAGILQVGVPASGPWQRMGYSFGDGKIWIEPERIRIRNT